MTPQKFLPSDPRRHNHVVVAVVILTVLFTVVLATARDIPPLRARVNDLAGMLSPGSAQTLEKRLADFEHETGHQIAVLTVPSLESETIEDFGIRAAEAWKIGQKGFDNGAILIIAQKERKLRIEVGYGLEGVLPDAIASRIIREVIVPRFRDGDFSGGIVAGVNAIMQVTKGEPLPEAARRANRQRAAQGGSLATVLMITAMLALFIGMTQRRLFGGIFGGSAVGLLAALTSSTGLAFGLALLVGAILGAIGSSLGPGASSQWSGGSRYRRGGWGGGFFPGGFGGGGFGGGGFGGGGGFSGGGGGFGGGGASGGW